MKNLKNKIRGFYIKVKLKIYFWVLKTLTKMTETELKRLLAIPENDLLKDYNYFFSYTNNEDKCLGYIVGLFKYKSDIDIDESDIAFTNIISKESLIKMNKDIPRYISEFGVIPIDSYTHKKYKTDIEYLCILKIDKSNLLNN